eukprot:gene5145-10284_t
MSNFILQDRDAFTHIIEYLSSSDVASTIICNKLLRERCNDDIIWSNLCKTDLGLEEFLKPPSITTQPNSFRETYISWRRAFSPYRIDHVKRIRLWWMRMESWLKRNAPPIYKTLGPPLSVADIKQFQDALNQEIPEPLQIIYRFHDGQRIPFVDFRPEPATFIDSPVYSRFYGIFGGYYFYDDFSCMRLLSLAQIVEINQHKRIKETRINFKQLDLSLYNSINLDNSQCIKANVNGNKRLHPPIIFSLHTNDPKKIPKTTNTNTNTNTTTTSHQQPPSSLSSTTTTTTTTPSLQSTTATTSEAETEEETETGTETGGGIFIWLEEYLRRLECGMYRVTPLDLTDEQERFVPKEVPRVISLFPQHIMKESGRERSEAGRVGGGVVTSSETRGGNGGGGGSGGGGRVTSVEEDGRYVSNSSNNRNSNDNRQVVSVTDGIEISASPVFVPESFRFNE